MLINAICGDVIGSTYENHNTRCLDFDILPKGSQFTDDTVMICAVAEWLIGGIHTKDRLIDIMHDYGNRYPAVGYGKSFRNWLETESREPYESTGNGAAMRIIPVGYYAKDLQEVAKLSHIVTSVTHNTPEAYQAAEAVASAIWLRHHGKTGRDVKDYIRKTYFYDLFDADQYEKVQDTYCGGCSCDESVPVAIACGLNYTSALDAIQHAVALGGDSDTIACIAAGICTGGIPTTIQNDIYSNYLDDDIREVISAFNDYI